MLWVRRCVHVSVTVGLRGMVVMLSGSIKSVALPVGRVLKHALVDELDKVLVHESHLSSTPSGNHRGGVRTVSPRDSECVCFVGRRYVAGILSRREREQRALESDETESVTPRALCTLLSAVTRTSTL